MDNREYVFVGNREYVLREMIKQKLKIVAVLVMKNSFLEKCLKKEQFIEYKVVHNKAELIDEITNTKFDILISNGNKYILPISELKKANYINIHPSFLPDLKGMDPVNGACLFKRSGGAACHLMDNGIDTGEIISRVEIPMTEDLDAALLYQLCFKAEVKAYYKAYERNFQIMKPQPDLINTIYYSMQPKDWLIDFNKGFDFILRQVKAFGYKSHGIYFSCNKLNYKFFRASEITNPFVVLEFSNKSDLEILLAYEDSVVFKFEGRILKFDGIGNRIDLEEGMKIENGLIENYRKDKKNVY